MSDKKPWIVKPTAFESYDERSWVDLGIASSTAMVASHTEATERFVRARLVQDSQWLGRAGWTRLPRHPGQSGLHCWS